jgi:hypothetical protein
MAEHDDRMQKGNKNPGQYGSTGGPQKGKPSGSNEDMDTPGKSGNVTGANRGQETGSMRPDKQGSGSSTGLTGSGDSDEDEDETEPRRPGK